MSTDLTVRYSEVMQAERDFNNLTRSSTTSSDYNDSTLSVRDARKRFEQLSSSSVATPSPSGQRGSESGSSGTTPAGRRPPPPRPLKKRASDSEIRTLSTTTPTPAPRGQSASNKSEDVNSKLDSTAASKTKKNLKKAHSVLASSSNSSEASSPSSDSSKKSTGLGSKKLFKRASVEKGKMDSTTTEAATNNGSAATGRGNSKKPDASQNSSSSPTHHHKKTSPLASKKKKMTSDSKHGSSQPSSPVDNQGKRGLQKSFSDKVLASCDERSVKASLKDEDKGKVVGGSRPDTPRVIEDGELKLNLAQGISLTGAELKAILNKQLAYVSGGIENGHLILTFPDVGLKNLETGESFKELETTIIYFKSLISIRQLNAGFTLVLDSHSSKTHNATKQLLERMAKEFPVKVNMVCIFVKSGLFGRSKSLASPEVCSKLHVATYSDSKSLVDQLGAENLTPELGGSLQYDHTSWVSNRLEFEKVQVLHRRAMTRVPEVTEALRVCEVPNSVKEAEHLMQEDLKLKENLVNKIAEAELNIDQFLTALDKEGASENVEVGSTPGSEEYVSMRDALVGMMRDMKTSQGQFDGFWSTHKARVDHMMRMCHFKKTAEELDGMIKGFMDDLTSGGVQLGDTLESALELGEKHEGFVNKCKTSMEEQLEKVREDSKILVNPQFAVSEADMHEATQKAVETVKVTMETVNSSHQKLMTMCQQKRDLFIVCVKFHMTTRQCTQWTQDVLEFLAGQPMESPSYKQANALINKIDDYLCRLQPTQIQSLQQLVLALPGERHFQKSVQKTAQKFEHSCELLNNRKTALLKVISAQVTASPSPSAKLKGKKHKDKDKDKPDIEILNSVEPSTNGNSPLVSNALSTTNPEASLYLAKTLVSETTDYSDGESDEATLKKRTFVFKELITTEEEYIKDLKTVIDSYYDYMNDNDELPLRLRGKRDVIFGNLPEIYKFHDVVFKEALEQFSDHPERIGECFVQFTEEFQMYSVYCKNRSNSETLMNESTESEAFFKGIQRNLNHQLPLNSYLLKPVQRITKYQLLLKDMMKHSVNAKKAHSDLQKALDRMLKVLKNLNDSLHVVGLKGFPGALAEQGRLLVHDAFQLWEGPSATRSIFSRPKNRHVFLFEKVIIFSKRIEAQVQQKRANKSDNYLYKGHLELAELALRETVDGQPLQFSLTVHGQNKDYRFQASDKEIHSMWSTEIRRLLTAQFTLMKDMVIKSGTLNRQTYKGKARQAKDSRLFGDSFKVRPGDAQAKKSSTSKLKLFRKRKNQDAGGKAPKKSESTSSESSLLASSTYPAAIRHTVKGSLAVPGTASLTQSNIETGRSFEAERKLSDSMSSDEEFDAFSEEDEEGSIHTVAVDHYESLAPGAPRYYVAISCYSPGDSDENGVALSVDQRVEVIGINQYGWWWVRTTNPSNGEMEEGWVPASYLKVAGSSELKLHDGWV